MIKKKVICIGEALVDRINSYSSNKSINYLGGAPANVVCALRKLNIPCAFVGAVGKDSFGLKFLKLFEKLVIDTDLLQLEDKFHTRIVVVNRNKDGDRFFSGFSNKKSNYFADEVLSKSFIESNIDTLKKLYEGSKFIITGTILLASPRSSEAIYFLLTFAHNYNIKIVIDLNWREIFWDNLNTVNTLSRKEQIIEIKKFIKFADILKLSKEEADMFFNSNNPRQISNSLSEKMDVIITNGGEPINWFVAGFEGTSAVPYSNQILDTTGAGDTFLAGFISQLIDLEEPIAKCEIEKAIQFGSICGLLTCYGEGAIEPQPDYEKVQSFLDS